MPGDEFPPDGVQTLDDGVTKDEVQCPSDCHPFLRRQVELNSGGRGNGGRL